MKSLLHPHMTVSWSGLALGALLLASCATPPDRPPAMPPASTAADSALRIASWNMEHLAEADGSGCRPRQETEYARMRDYMARIDADVIAFQEVESAAAAARVFTPDKYDIVFSQRLPSQRDSLCRGLESQGLKIRQQGVGFAIRKGVEFQRHADLKQLGLGDPDLRWGVDISVREGAGESVRLLAVHLKSGCFDKNDLTPICASLFKQAEVLKGWVAQREAERAHYAILGDWNRRLGNRDDKFWWKLRHSTAQGVRLKDVNGNRRPACSHYASYIDHIVLSPSVARGYDEASFDEYIYKETGQPEHLSDHCAISIDLH